jgi:hypothetical protein
MTYLHRTSKLRSGALEEKPGGDMLGRPAAAGRQQRKDNASCHIKFAPFL